ncbi:polysaccharide deacetylase family protein [Mucilaginibacter pineti]|uniref:hypothetical protein n=1 Tax=Mucilaginibacter pineti TaxID=1391627 RepID=UPI00115FFB14|nr:hypothetical protein [Mucilaginibacter pineti]
MKQSSDFIPCYSATKIYIFCPAGFATGGPEALHQLGARLKELGFNAFMHYYTTPDSVDVVHENYKKYGVPVTDELENKAQHIMVLPETHLLPIFEDKYQFIRKAIWWLSVVNYYITQNDFADTIKDRPFFKLRAYFGDFRLATFRKLRRRNDVINISHSHFSKVHLLENRIKPVGAISDYMNHAFFDLVNESTVKEDLIIYNPIKNDEFLAEIMSLTPTLSWMPIQGMTPVQVAALMNRAKLYIDFGYHPGKERMPREACIMRCSMIVGKSGSAAYQEDMPIPDKYRFEKSRDQIPTIIERINECLNNYDRLIADFEPYRKALYREEEEFTNAIKRVFVQQ